MSSENILGSLGVPTGKADDYLHEKICTLISECTSISSPCACQASFNNPLFIKNQGIMVLNGISFNLHKIVLSALQKSSEVILFMGTCGAEVEIYSKQLIKDGHLLEGLIVDLVGSEIAEGVAEFIHHKTETEMATIGFGVTNRYSPGYCQWPVNDQQQLFSLLKGNSCGVELNRSSLMIPIKSVSGVIGVGRFVKKSGYSCAVCNVDHCLYRDKKPGS